MRYLAGFVGGLVVAILLFAFQDHLIGGERNIDVRPAPQIFLPVVKTSEPPETKPYEPEDPPPKPELVDRPTLANPGPSTPPVRPEIPLAPSLDGIAGPGEGPYITWGGGPRRMDGGPSVKFPVAPQYPADALHRGVEGEVEVEFTILADGSVADVRVLRSDPPGVFEQSARRAIQRWEFLPRVQNGEPVEARVRQVIEFRLPAQAQ